MDDDRDVDELEDDDGPPEPGSTMYFLEALEVVPLESLQALEKELTALVGPKCLALFENDEGFKACGRCRGLWLLAGILENSIAFVEDVRDAARQLSGPQN